MTHAHTVIARTGTLFPRLACSCGHESGPAVSDRAAREEHAAHANGTPIPQPVRPLLLGGAA